VAVLGSPAGAAPGLEPGASRLVQRRRCAHLGAVQGKTHGWCGGTFLRLWHLGFPPAVFLLYSHTTEGTKGVPSILVTLSRDHGEGEREEIIGGG